MGLKRCRTCGGEVSSEAKVCPHCGQTDPVKHWCFIATAVYGSYYSREVSVLRQFRDNVLLKNFIGKLLVVFYYKISPAFVIWFQNKPLIRKQVKMFLDLFVKILCKTVLKPEIATPSARNDKRRGLQ